MPIKELKTFTLSWLQVLDENGTVDPALEPALDADQLSRLYRAMFFAREADGRMLKLQRQGRVGTFAPSTGQEAVCGAVLAMTDKDWLVPTFRETPALYMRGVPFAKNLLFHNGFEEGNHLPGLDRTLPIAIIVGSQTLHAVGLAYAMKLKGERDAAVVAFVGDGGTSEGDFLEALNFAAVWQVPCVFICQNNQWAISVPRSKQTRSETIAQKGLAFDVPCLQLDGNDPLALYRATKEALDRAHGGGGPTFIEAVTYRMMMHTTADDPTRYRTDAEVEGWKAKDPLTRLKVYLENKKSWSAAQEAALLEEVTRELEAGVKELESFKGWKPDAPFDYVFSTTHEVIEEQRAEFLAHRARKEVRHG